MYDCGEIYVIYEVVEVIKDSLLIQLGLLDANVGILNSIKEVLLWILL